MSGDAVALVRRASRKIMLRLLPPLSLGYLLLLLDRAAVSTVAPQLGPALGLSPFAVGLATPILFLGVLLFEVPSALLAGRLGARRWLAAMLLAWGAASLATAFATGPAAFYAARIVSSAAQAGFLPVALYWLASSVPAACRTRVLTFVVLVALAGAVLGPGLASLLTGLDGALGLAAWRWLFLGLGLPCLLLAPTLLRLPDQPAAATWLTAAERDALAWTRSVDGRAATPGLGALLDPRLLLLAGVNFGLSLSAVAAGSWYAAMMQDRRAPVLAVTLITVLATAATTFAWAWRLDRTKRLIDGLVVACALASVGFAAGVFSGTVVTMLIGLMAHGATVAAARTMLWSAGSRLALSGGGAAAFAVIDATGLVATFIAPRVVVALAQSAENLQLGLAGILLALLAATGLASLLQQLGQRE